MDKNREDLTRGGPQLGGPVRSIRKNHVLPGSGPTELHYGKNGYVRCTVLKFGMQIHLQQHFADQDPKADRAMRYPWDRLLRDERYLQKERDRSQIS